MALPTALNDREFRKFEEVAGEPAVRVTGTNFSGSFTFSGLKIGGKVTEVTVNSATWTAIPSTALSSRNTIAIQNLSGQEIKINYDNSVAGYVGMVISDGSERTYDITDQIIIYAKASSGNATLNVEEIA